MRYLSIAIIASLLRGVSTDVTCTAGTFSMGTKGFVRCDLGKDVRKEKYQFSVVHCETVLCDAHTKTYPLVCNIDDGTLKCDADLVPGYSFDHQVDSSLTLIVTTVNSNTTGLYYCQVMSDGSPRHTCNLSPTGPPAATARTPISHSSTTKNPENPSHAESEGTADPQGFPVKFVVVLAVLLAVLVVCGLLIYFLVFIRYKNSRRPDAAEGQEDIEAASSLCETFAIFCKCLTPPPNPKPPTNPKVDASTITCIVMKDKEVQVSRGGGLMKKLGFSKSKENLTSDTVTYEKMGESECLLPVTKQVETVAESELPLENQDDKMDERLLLEENTPVVEVEVAVSSEKHTGAVKKKSEKSSGGGILSKFWPYKTQKSSENPDNTDTGEEKEVTNMDGILKTEESKLPSEKHQDKKMAESEWPKENQDEKFVESERLLSEGNPSVDEVVEGVVGLDKHTGARAKPGKDGKKKSEKSHGRGMWPRERKNTKSSETTDAIEEVQLKTKEGKIEEPECLLPEKHQDEKKADAEPLLRDEKPTVVETESAVKLTGDNPEPDKVGEQQPGKSSRKKRSWNHWKGSKAPKK